MKDILALINDYQLTVQAGVEEMQNQFNTKQLLKAWKRNIIAKNGTLDSGTEYDFHGIGCFLTNNDITVNFDFGPDDRYDGFDLWRLRCFVNEKKGLYQKYFEDKNFLEEDFQVLVNRKIIVKTNWFPGSSLYYFYNDVK